MIDLKLIRSQIEEIASRLKARGYLLDVAAIKSLEEKRRDCLKHCEALQMQRNQLAREIGVLKKSGQDANDLLEKAQAISEETKQSEQTAKSYAIQLDEILSYVPNIPHESVPQGLSEADNVVVRQWGKAPDFDFEVKDHEALCQINAQIDVETAARLSGSRFMVLKSEISKLHRALSQWMLDVHTEEHGYTEYNVPVLSKPSTLYGTGQLPKFREDLFVTNDERELMLIPTAEVQLVNLVADQIVAKESLPMAFCSHSLCFRKEAGSYGKDTKGIFRMHQFEKVELVRIVEPESSYDELEKITQHAENILKKLNLHHQVVSLCTGDLGFAATKTYEIEVWIPSQKAYREISSCSNTEAFQTRRIKARFKNDKKQSVFMHALNGSGVAVGRLLIALLENNQRPDGSISIPTVLQPYMGNKEFILQPKHRMTTT
ncbi:MAG: serine--tRNA ligase [Pseudomonadota bacterium]|nr:serine--tRNA ligase [Pseudomonadota bacterium]